MAFVGSLTKTVGFYIQQRDVHWKKFNLDDLKIMAQSDNNVETSMSAPDLLAKGFVDLYRPSLEKIESDLKELTNKQKKIHQDLNVEIGKISDDKLADIQTMIMKMKTYKEKLVAIKRQMVHIHHRTRNLKRRSTTLQSFKQAEVDAKIQKRHREEHLIAGSPTTESTATVASVPPSDAN